LTDENDLLTFDSEAPENILAAGPILNLNGQDLIGIDIRPSTGELYGIGSLGWIYRINPVTRVSNTSGGQNSYAGSRFGVDFDPVADRMRIVAETDINVRLDVDTGNSPGNSLLNYGPGQPGATGDNPSVVAIAYSNNNSGPPATTTLYGIDVRGDEDRLVIIDPANSGVLTVVGPLGLNASALAGFDIVSLGATQFGYASLQLTDEGISKFYRINLATGGATLVGDIGGGDLIDGIALVPLIPEPATLGMAAFAIVGGLAVRRRSRY
jgi:hypothetical protein